MQVTSLVLMLGAFTVIAGLPKIRLSDEDRLIKNLLARYRRRGKYGRPVIKYNDTVKVSFNIQLVQIMDLDEKNQILTLNVWDRYTWDDIYLKWDPTDWGGVNSVRIPSRKLWTPDIKLYNYADFRLEEHREALCVISNTGTVVWMPQAVYRSSCYIDVSAFPFDIQKCHLKFGSWTYDGTKVDLAVLDNATEIDLSEYVPSNSWTIIRSPAVRNVVTYTCCPVPYVDLTFTLVFQRSSTFYNYILILPCVLLTSLTLVLFWIPPESPAKLMLGINIFVAFFLLLLLMESNLPPAAATVPLLGTYYCLNMILITLSSFLNAFVVNLSFYGARRPVPMCLRKVLFSFFAKILCMDNLVMPFLETNHTTRLLAESTRFLGINGDQKWKKDSSASGDLLVQMKRSPSDEQSGQLALINFHLTELMDFVRSYRERISERDRKEKLAKEWKAIGLIFDRIFFIIYITTIIVSMSVLLPIITFSKP
ncbi:neuronal acetylcholine receptor subunit beta-3 isoform X2 [Patella vulgata]|uniref:neuronal acetylcholine receptor subunit beta-3 isoform X2 n=1 Tax=Patella vulgata TaxID=6465 RepID=UPI00217FCD28|nr:neuronal acetylcholine receptor subunit beta-3 isoform X2 [Patella vulgata]XP_050391653.1 neuronal acetylcholine receptor subunit beta-3 isoform X2 [Patella vulgata]XP_050391654.1 neuronal acetylcholine receptor subunit beta-3 isoform X2 [Patella vulgata]XP_050391655.1 neuronal acetylcholine receptor subunit beta-3 isoform X2 [Patella vulgata]